MAKILIIGKTGQLGSELAKLFRQATVPDMDEFDLTRPADAENYILTLKPDIIINTAACNDLNKCEENPYNAFSLNWFAVQNLALAAKKIRALLIHFSTNYVFDGKEKGSYKEDDTPLPLQIYGMSKLAGEDSVIRQYPEGSIIIRTSFLFGGKGSPEKGNFVLNRIKDFKNKKKLVMDSRQFFSITYAVDLALVVKRLIELNPEPGLYHVANKGACSPFELTQYIATLVKSDCKLAKINRDRFEDKIRRPIYTRLSTEKIESMGIKLPFWKNAVERYLVELNLK